MAILSGHVESVESADATSGQPVATGMDDTPGWAQAPTNQAANSGPPTGRALCNGLKWRSVMSHINENTTSGQR